MRHYRFVDWATQCYAVVAGLLILLFHGGAVPAWPWLVAAHFMVVALIHWLLHCAAQGRGGAPVRFLHAFYPILLYTGFYRVTGLVNEMFIPGNLDPVFIRWDQVLFGSQPSLTFMDRFPQRWVAELMYGCYFSYYLMIVGVGLILLLRRRDQFDHFLAVVSISFYVCYFTYLILPVMGPRIFFLEGDMVQVIPEAWGPPSWGGALDGPPPPFPESVQAGWFYQVVIFLYIYFESEGAAFPSSHVALAVVTLYFSWIYLPRLRWVHLVLAVGLCLGTVYCRYHYVVDVFAGLAVAAVMVPVGNCLYARFTGGLPERSTGPS